MYSVKVGREWKDLPDEEILAVFKAFGLEIKGVVWLQVARAIIAKFKERKNEPYRNTEAGVGSVGRGTR